MASLSDLPFKVRTFLRWYRYRTAPWKGARLARPLAEARIAMVTTAGLYASGQPAFDVRARGGDFTWREIAFDTPPSSLLTGHRSQAFDHAGLERDRNLALPFDRLREMRDEGRIGSVNGRHFSFMGSITRPARLVEETAPEVAERLAADGVDAVLLTPF